MRCFSKKPGFNPGAVHMRSVVKKGTSSEVLYKYFSFPLSVSFYQCFRLIFILKTILSECPEGAAW
jgi:hypothetical protein